MIKFDPKHVSDALWTLSYFEACNTPIINTLSLRSALVPLKVSMIVRTVSCSFSHLYLLLFVLDRLDNNTVVIIPFDLPLPYVFKEELVSVLVLFMFMVYFTFSLSRSMVSSTNIASSCTII